MVQDSTVTEIAFSGQAADGSQLRLMHVHAHPDDESSKGAATTAKYVAEGASVMVVTCTGGEAGSVLNPAMDRPDVWENIAAVRKQEMSDARDVLGVEHRDLGFIDSGLPEGDPLPPLPEGTFATLDPREAAIPPVKAIREYRPHVITTYDEAGGYPHPDHIQTHNVTMEAVRMAADARISGDGLGQPWEILKVYYQLGFHRRKFAAIDQAMQQAGLTSPYAERLAGWQDMNYEYRVTTKVRCEDYFAVRDRALLAHRTQIDPDGMWFAVPREIEKKAWPTEEFQLVYSKVPVTVPEDDLFNGLRPEGYPSTDPTDNWVI